MNILTTTAVRFRLVMSLLLGLLVTLTVVIAFFGMQQLDTRAEEVSKVVYEADNSEQKLNSIKSLRANMDSQPDAVRRAQQIVAESKSYSYQNVIVKDVMSMASRAGVEITNYTFSDPGEEAAGGAAPAATPQAPAAPATDPATDPAAAATPPGMEGATPQIAQSQLKSVSFNITLKTPLEYTRLLNFIHYVEQNATKMQIATLTLSKGESNNTVSIDALTIEVYVR